MSNNSHPMIMAKSETALAVIISKNPEIETSARLPIFAKKERLLDSLYDFTWDKGNGRQQLIKFVYNGAKYGTAIGREYHKFKKETRVTITGYDPEKGKHTTEEEETVTHDEPYFEV
ncbi:MAG: hypothetical protein AAB787_01700, partial [Patescibacteria group bacterium]